MTVGPRTGTPNSRWAVLTGEYPPQPGGVSDYTRLVAEGLAAVGDEVAVYAPPQGLGPDSAPPGSGSAGCPTGSVFVACAGSTGSWLAIDRTESFSNTSPMRSG